MQEIRSVILSKRLAAICSSGKGLSSLFLANLGGWLDFVFLKYEAAAALWRRLACCITRMRAMPFPISAQHDKFRRANCLVFSIFGTIYTHSCLFTNEVVHWITDTSCCSHPGSVKLICQAQWSLLETCLHCSSSSARVAVHGKARYL